LPACSALEKLVCFMQVSSRHLQRRAIEVCPDKSALP
jgi:hypothetical protein